MSGLTWLRRLGPYQIQTRSLGDWQVLEVRGKFAAGASEQKFRDEVENVLRSGARRVVVDLTQSRLAGDAVANAAAAVYHKARATGTDLRFVVLPGKAGGYYHMAGLEMTIPTFASLNEAISH